MIPSKLAVDQIDLLNLCIKIMDSDSSVKALLNNPSSLKFGILTFISENESKFNIWNFLFTLAVGKITDKWWPWLANSVTKSCNWIADDEFIGGKESATNKIFII